MTGQAEQLRVRKDDSGRPRLVNGGFEETATEGELAGWFYARNARVRPDPSAPEGQHVLELTNDSPRQNCHAIQALGVDGRVLSRIELSVRAWTRGVVAQPDSESLPRAFITFYDENRAAIRQDGVGPWQGNTEWSQYVKEIPVPGRARLATLCVGMFGATGHVLVDDIQMQAVGED
jgi:hypothetical protein